MVLGTALRDLRKMISHLVEAGEVRNAYFTHKLDFELLAVPAEFGRLHIASLFQLFLVANGVLQHAEFFGSLLDVGHGRDLLKQRFIVQ